MKKIQTERTASQRANEGRRGRTALIVLILCAMLTIGTAASAAVLGGSLSRYSQKESHVIPLVPEEQQLRAVGERVTVPAAKEETPTPTESPEAASETTAPQTVTIRWNMAAQNNNTARASEYRGNLRVYDAVRSWSTETQVDLFKESYNESGSVTVKAEDGEKVVAPGTSNFYTFTLENNGNLPLDYTISLKVENDNESAESKTDIPLEWRLLNGNAKPVTDWRGYSETAEVMEESALAARNRNNYTIEWRWAFERGADADRTDTELGDLAAEQLLDAKATITVYAEERNGQIPSVTPKPSGGWQGKPLWPKTGDNSNLILYTVLMTISGGGLLLLVQGVRQRKKRE